jgi:signal transduction histidine kinase
VNRMSTAPNVIEFSRRRQAVAGVPVYDDAEQAVVDERRRIARELHDVIGYGLSTISLQAGVAARAVDDPTRVAGALDAIRAASCEALDDVRAILGVLRHDDVRPTGTAPGLARLDALAAATTAAGVETTVRVSGRRRPVDANVDVTAYRIVQESLTNVLRHANATAASVTVVYDAQHLVVEVGDDGSGGCASDRSGSGIAGMRERARSAGGELEAGSIPGGGFLVRARLSISGRA